MAEGSLQLFPNGEVCNVSVLHGDFNASAVFLFSLLTPFLLWLSAFLIFIYTRILFLNYPSRSGQERRDCPCRVEGKSDKDEMTHNPLAYSADLLDGGLEDFQIKSLSPLYQKVVQDENHPMLIDSLEDPTDALVDNLKISALDHKRTPPIISQGHPPRVSPPSKKPKTEPIKLVEWYGEISWSLKGTSVFDDAEQELDAFMNRTNMLDYRKPYNELWLFQYGLRYIPSISDTNVYRTIRIEEIPLDKNLSQILPLIVGEIYSARLADTYRITGYNTAMITFVTEEDAANFVAGSVNRTYSLPFGRVIPVHTPTYPIPADIEKLIVEQGCTRILGIFHGRPTLKREITRAMTSPYQNHLLQLESIVDGPGIGEVSVKMLSVKAAAVVFDWLRNHPTLSKCQFRFLKQDGTTSEGTAMMLDDGYQTPLW